MAKNTKQTSKKVASKASKVLRGGRYSKTSKSVAGSALVLNRKLNTSKNKIKLQNKIINRWNIMPL